MTYTDGVWMVNKFPPMQFPGMPYPMTHLSFSRCDRGTEHDWRELQRIKNEVLGKEWEACEIYPADSRLVDAANQFHLWCVAPGLRFPFGFDERLVSDVEVWGTTQRPGSGATEEDERVAQEGTDMLEAAAPMHTALRAVLDMVKEEPA